MRISWIVWKSVDGVWNFSTHILWKATSFTHFFHILTTLWKCEANACRIMFFVVFLQPRKALGVITVSKKQQ